MPFLKINRFGRVVAPKTGYTEYEYQVSAVCSTQGKNIGEDGVIIDHNLIHDVVRDLFNEEIGSEEGLELKLAERIFSLFEQHRKNIFDLYIKITPVRSDRANHAYMEYSHSGRFLK